MRWQFVASGAQAFLGGGYLLVLGRGLGSADFGVYSIVTALISVAGMLLEMRIQDVVAREFCDIDGKQDKSGQSGFKLIDLFILETIGRMLPVLGLILLSPLLVRVSHLQADAAPLVMLAALGFLAGKAGIGVSTGLLRVLGRTDLIALCVTADWGLRLLFTLLLLVFGGLTIASALWVVLVVGGLANACQLLVASREFMRRVGPLGFADWSPRSVCARLQQDRRLIASNIGMSVSDLMGRDLDITIIASLISTEKVGLYKMAKSLVQVIWQAISPFYLAIMPEVQRLWKNGEQAQLKILLAQTSKWLFTLAVALVAVSYVLVLMFGVRLLGSDYARLPSLMLLMSIWVIVGAPLVWGHPLAVAIGHPEIAVVGGLLGTAAGFVAFLALTTQYGLTGAAVAWVITLSVSISSIAGLAVYRFDPDRAIT